MAMRPSDPNPGCPSPSRWLSVTSTRTLMYLFKARKVKRQVGYPLVTYKKLWKITIFSGKTHYKWSFSIAMLNYQRVLCDTCWWICQNLDQSQNGIAKTQRRNMTSLYLWLCTVATSKHFHICSCIFIYFHIHIIISSPCFPQTGHKVKWKNVSAPQIIKDSPLLIDGQREQLVHISQPRQKTNSLVHKLVICIIPSFKKKRKSQANGKLLFDSLLGDCKTCESIPMRTNESMGNQIRITMHIV